VKIARFILVTVVGSIIGLIGGYVPAGVVLNVMVQLMSFPYEPSSTADIASRLAGFGTAGAIVAIFQRATGFAALPRWWPFLSGAGWAALIALASGVRDSEGNDLRLAVSAGLIFSLVVGGALWFRRRNAPEAMRPASIARAPSRFSGFRIGVFAVPAYLIFVGIGHTVLAQVMSAQATGPRDGQAFMGTFILGLMLVVVGLFAVAATRERGIDALARAASIGLIVAVAVVGYTYTRGYDVGGVPGERHCIVEQGREVCPSGDGTYIKDARPDVVVIVLAALGAYAFAHVLGRRAAKPSAAIAPAS
jgi:hypothetical protein